MTTYQPACHGDEAELYERYARTLGRLVARRVRTSRANIEDACSYAWMQMLRHQPAREAVLGWLLQTGIREAIRLDRRDRRYMLRPDQSETVAERESPMERRLELLSACQAVAAAGLRDREADLLALRTVGYSYREIAAARGVTERTVERQLARAGRKLNRASQI